MAYVFNMPIEQHDKSEPFVEATPKPKTRWVLNDCKLFLQHMRQIHALGYKIVGLEFSKDKNLSSCILYLYKGTKHINKYNIGIWLVPKV